MPLRGISVAEPERCGDGFRVGKQCKECGNTIVIKEDGCEFCAACRAFMACG